MGVIIGGAVGNVVSAVTSDLLMPVVGLFLPGGDWREAKLVLRTTTDAAGETTESAILYGHFAGTLLNFLIISMVLFLIVKAILRPAPSAPEPTRQCLECLETIPANARRCRACTTVVG